jgi:dynactin 1
MTHFLGKIEDLHNELAPLKKSLKEAIAARQIFEKKNYEFVEQVEMLTLDKEMAEERAELLQAEVETLKEKVEELSIDLEVFKHEREGNKMTVKNRLLSIS